MHRLPGAERLFSIKLMLLFVFALVFPPDPCQSVVDFNPAQSNILF